MTSSAHELAIDVRDLEHGYPDGSSALDGLSLQVRPGERVALLGPNGAGKTTLALHLNGILLAQHGSVTIDGLPVVEPNLAEVRRRLQLVFAEADDQLFMPTVRDDVAFGPANHGMRGADLDAAVDGALAAAGAAALAKRAPHHLSTGEKRRAALATVLAMNPGTLVLDEPTAGLDPAGRNELVALLKTLPQTLVVITHDIPFALQLCHRSVIIDEGRSWADAPTADLLADRATLGRHRLALPFGFDPNVLAQATSIDRSR